MSCDALGRHVSEQVGDSLSFLYCHEHIPFPAHGLAALSDDDPQQGCLVVNHSSHSTSVPNVLA